MIIVYHHHNKVTEIMDYHIRKNLAVPDRENMARKLLQLAAAYPDRLLLWCDEACRELLDVEQLKKRFHHKKQMLSYGAGNFMPPAIGYVDESLFCNPDKGVRFPTWQMQVTVGGLHAGMLNALQGQLKEDQDFAYFLCSLAKRAMPLGLQCYSEPALLKKTVKEIAAAPQASVAQLFRFVKQHYRIRWILLLVLNLWLYERKITLLPFIQALFYRKRNLPKVGLDAIPDRNSDTVPAAFEVAVIIPTIGRKIFLYEVLKDLAAQTVIPKKVIIVEQNPQPGSSSELEYLEQQVWPFAIAHRFTHQTGACNARNIALSLVEHEWVFFADDDIRLKPDFLEKAGQEIVPSGGKAFTLSCLQKGDESKYHYQFQWTTFGSGCSIVHREALQGLTFDLRFENGFGEDADFGMQLRHKGYDVLYLPQPEILHLKAAVGGFRVKPVLEWQNEKIQPKPSPTVMLYRILHHTKQQLQGYKTTLFIKFYKHQPDKNPVSYYRKFQKAWQQSQHWANVLKARK